MSDSLRLAHQAFVDVLASIDDDDSPRWRAVSAGWLSVRLIDAWMSARLPEDLDDLQQQRNAVRGAIKAIPEGTATRGSLTRLLDAFPERTDGAVGPLRDALTAYARQNEDAADWALALDVYRTVREMCRLPDDTGVAITTLIRMAECHRQLAEWDAAHAVLDRALDLVAAAGDGRAALEARCYAAEITSERGDLPAADQALLAVERDAMRLGLPEVRALARHGRAHVAFQRRDFNLAARFAYEAHEELRDPVLRERAMADLAAAFAELGLRAAARDAHLIVVATTQQAYMRWTALINLMEIAGLDGNEAAYEAYRRELSALALPPRLAAFFHFYAGAGARALTRVAEARTEYERALAIASEHELAQLVIESERALKAIVTPGLVAERLPVPRPAPETTEIVRRVGRMRAALVGDAS